MLSASDPNGRGGCSYFARRVTAGTPVLSAEVLWCRRCRQHSHFEGTQRPQGGRRRLQRRTRGHDVIDDQYPPGKLPAPDKHRPVKPFSSRTAGLRPVPGRTPQSCPCGNAQTPRHRPGQELGLVIASLSLSHGTGWRPRDQIGPARLDHLGHTEGQPGHHRSPISVLEAPHEMSGVVLIGQQGGNRPTGPGREANPALVTRRFAHCAAQQTPPYQEHDLGSTEGLLHRTPPRHERGRHKAGRTVAYVRRARQPRIGLNALIGDIATSPR